jgi:hypothetical protein
MQILYAVATHKGKHFLFFPLDIFLYSLFTSSHVGFFEASDNSWLWGEIIAAAF